LDTDPYLGTREKEDAFLLRVLETIRAGLNQGAPTNAADTLLQLLQGIQPQPALVEEVLQKDQQEVDDMALDFVDGFLYQKQPRYIPKRAKSTPKIMASDTNISAPARRFDIWCYFLLSLIPR